MQYFGTDGIRGVVGGTITPKTAFLVGYAVAKVFKKLGQANRLIVGKDTRNSCDCLVSALSSGASYAGADVLEVGILPTAAVSYLTKKYSAIGGVMVTGSHNAPEFNGFMIFDFKGYKIDKSMQLKIEEIVGKNSVEMANGLGKILYEERGHLDYLQFLKDAVNYNFTGLKVRLDVAHGTAGMVAVSAFEHNGASVTCDNASSDGDMVNVGCGTEELSRFSGAVVRGGADVGFVFDADADRMLAIDEKGKVVSGDKILFLFASYLLEQSRLLKSTIVGTNLTSLALEKALLARSIKLERVEVGEQNIVAKLNSKGLMIGGETCGKIILRDYLPTSDGILVALFVAKIIKDKQKPLSELVKEVKDLPIEQKNYIMDKAKRTRLEKSEAFISLLDRLAQCDKDIRIVARASGTEDVFRVIVEANTKRQMERAIKKIEQFVLNFV